MPITKSAEKALRASKKKRVINDRRRDAMRKSVKQVKKLVLEQKPKDAKSALSLAYQAIDKAAKRGVIKPNAAARKKSRLSAMAKKSA